MQLQAGNEGIASLEKEQNQTVLGPFEHQESILQSGGGPGKAVCGKRMKGNIVQGKIS